LQTAKPRPTPKGEAGGYRWGETPPQPPPHASFNQLGKSTDTENRKGEGGGDGLGRLDQLSWKIEGLESLARTNIWGEERQRGKRGKKKRPGKKNKIAEKKKTPPTRDPCKVGGKECVKTKGKSTCGAQLKDRFPKREGGQRTTQALGGDFQAWRTPQRKNQLLSGGCLCPKCSTKRGSPRKKILNER